MGRFLLRNVSLGIVPISQRPSLGHQPFVQVGSIRIKADCNQPTVAAALAAFATHRPRSNKSAQGFPRRLAAVIPFARRVQAVLPRFGSIHAFQPHSFTERHKVNGVAVQYFRISD